MLGIGLLVGGHLEALRQRPLRRLGRVGHGGGPRCLGHADLFFSKRLRRTMAIELISSTNTSMAMIVADAFATLNASSGCLAKVVTVVGSATKRSLRWPGSTTLPTSSPPPWLKNPVTAPTTMRGAASPTARAIESNAPVKIPGAA